ncbi:MAG: hypothetical protein MI749_01090 [Desulfovibrionales bacterium]|nr:hypothetical protein [Desulfovibrionales bacterium]
MKYMFKFNRSVMKFVFETCPPTRKSTSGKKSPKNENDPIKEAKLRCIKAKRRLRGKLLSLKSSPKYFLTFTFDLDVLPEMRAFNDEIDDATWKDFIDYRDKLTASIRKKFPEGWGIWVAEVGRKNRPLHIHIFFRDNEGLSRKKVEKWARKEWDKITDCNWHECVDVKKIWHKKGLMHYVFNKKKVNYLYRLHPHNKDDKKQRTTSGIISKKNMKFNSIHSVRINEEILSEIIEEVISAYRKACKKDGIRPNKRHIKLLRKSNGYSHIFNDETHWKICRKVLKRHGLWKKVINK